MFTRLLCFLVKFAAIPLWLYEFSRRHRSITIFIVSTNALCAAIIIWLGETGAQLILQALAYGIQILAAIAFMVVQFVALFWFISRTRATEIRPGDPKTVTFDDYWGSQHIVELVKQWNLLMVDRKKFTEMGGRSCNGILLTGKPGTGKTLLAKALAGSGGVAFYGIEGSGFRAMFWGVDVMKVMGFFSKCRKLARQYGGAIGFIDEIDAIGQSRGGGMSRQGQIGAYGGLMGGMMGSGALTRLLYEMDGLEDIPLFDMCQNKIRRWLGLPDIDQGRVMVLGSTNMPEVLDAALTRPGRFDRKIEVDLPDRASRRAIIEGYLRKIAHDDIDVDAIVADTVWATPAQIMSALTKDATRIALFSGRDKVTQADVEQAFQEQYIGLANPISDLDPEQKKQIAAHEAGHAIAQYHLRKDERMVQVSIIRRGGALGYMMPVPKMDIYAMPLEVFVADICVSLAGHVGAELVMGKPWTGASADLEGVRSRVYALAAFGAFGIFPMAVGADPLAGSDMGKAVNDFLKDCLNDTRRLLVKHRAELDTLMNALLEKGTLSGKEAIALIEEVNKCATQD